MAAGFRIVPFGMQREWEARLCQRSPLWSGCDGAAIRCHVRGSRVQVVISSQPCRWPKLPAGHQDISGAPFSLAFSKSPSTVPSERQLSPHFPCQSRLEPSIASRPRPKAILAPPMLMVPSMGNAPSNNDGQDYTMKPAETLPLTEKCLHYTARDDVPPELQKWVLYTGVAWTASANLP